MKRLKNVLQQGRAGYLRQKGQAMIEYTIVTVFGILVLTTGPGRGVIEDLEDAIRNNYNGFSYAVSLSDYPDKDDVDDLEDMYETQGLPEDRIEYLADDPVDLISDLIGFDVGNIPDVTEGVDLVDGIKNSLDPADFCDICSGGGFSF